MACLTSTSSSKSPIGDSYHLLPNGPNFLTSSSFFFSRGDFFAFFFLTVFFFVSPNLPTIAQTFLFGFMSFLGHLSSPGGLVNFGKTFNFNSWSPNFMLTVPVAQFIMALAVARNGLPSMTIGWVSPSHPT
ncbi:hypothetical protein HanHA300_Chr16g0613221 [Helianthus annuus]|nr:hypothetical protein HanHA300_Chr16g0613221 [Helianthus annuus]KAJ0460694.1 hypothetical protein HanHA89_Chr16g0663811 [Helianthus annuus]